MDMRAVLLIWLMLLPLSAQAAEIPFGVSPKQVEESGDLTIGDRQLMGLDARGKLLPSYEYKVGNRIGVEVDEIHYELRFWNVGKMGGTSGYLFWKKDFGKATLIVTPIASTPGSVVAEEVDNSEFKMPNGFRMEPAERVPELDPTSCSLTFSGGPTGTFEGICSSGEKVAGTMVSGGAVTFKVAVQEQTPLALQWANMKELRFSTAPFSDWKFDESQLEDSGARFSSMNGEVEVRHEQDSAWEFAKLDTPLYVLDHVKTGEESQAIIGFADLSTFLLKEESEIVVTTPPKKDSKLRLVAGNIWANVKKLAKDGTMEVEMSQAVAGIKGTTFVLEDDGTHSTIKVIEGTVVFTAKNGSTPPAVVGAGETVTATRAGLAEKTAFDVARESAAWQAGGRQGDAAGGFSGNPLMLGASALALFFVLAGGFMAVRRRRSSSGTVAA